MRFISPTRAALVTLFSLLTGCGSSPTPGPLDGGMDAPADAPAVDAPPVDAAPYRCERAPRVAAPAVLSACNGAALCGRRYSDVAYATTHNAMSNADARWVSPNQNHGITRQLEDGVRGLMLDAHPWMDDAYLCHGVCLLGHQPLAEGLCEVTRFLDTHPTEIVSIIFESYISAQDTERAFRASGLMDYVARQPREAPWPTLGEMVRADARAVVFTDREGGAFAWYHSVFQYAFETRYAFETPEQMDCAPNRGSASNTLFILNHFLTAPLASPALAERVNHNPFLIDRARRCVSERHRMANFVTVDFYDLGDALSVVAELNRSPM